MFARSAFGRSVPGLAAFGRAEAQAPVSRRAVAATARGHRFMDSMAKDDCGHVGLTSSMRKSGAPGKNGDSDFTKAGPSPSRIQTCESGGVLSRSVARHPG